MNEKTNSFVRDRFAEFYEKESSRIEAPTSIEHREFGFLLFKENIMIRHRSFSNVEKLRSSLRRSVPLHVYYSTAYYEMPEEDMEKKGWLGADLYFDIDADHIPTHCAKVHDKWTCSGCGFFGKGITPEKCPSCGAQSFDEKTWPCETCLESAKQETIKLINILTHDFGFSTDEVMVSFSGQRGYHVYIENEENRTMDSLDRKEIADYITGTGLEAEFHGLGKVGSRGVKTFVGPVLDDFGWRGRIAKGTYEFLRDSTKDELQHLGLNKKVVEAIIASKETILRSWQSSGPWNLVKGVGPESWKLITQEGLRSQSVKIDTVVTTDIHRLIRLANTLNGKTGLMKVAFPATQIEKFDPFSEAVAFTEGEATVIVEEAPQFRLREETFGPLKNRKVELPMAAAVLLLCKDLAEVAD